MSKKKIVTFAAPFGNKGRGDREWEFIEVIIETSSIPGNRYDNCTRVQLRA